MINRKSLGHRCLLEPIQPKQVQASDDANIVTIWVYVKGLKCRAGDFKAPSITVVLMSRRGSFYLAVWSNIARGQCLAGIAGNSIVCNLMESRTVGSQNLESFNMPSIHEWEKMLLLLLAVWSHP